MEEDKSSAPGNDQSLNETKNKKSVLLPVDLIQPRWEMMGPQERAFATCLLECVQLEYLIRKNLPSANDTLDQHGGSELNEEIKVEDNAEIDENDLDSPSLTQEIVAPVKYSMGRIAWEFATYPDYVDLLNSLNIRYQFIKMVKFRNYLIHRVDSGQYVSSKLKKRYITLSRMLYFLKRWPQLLAVYSIMERMIADWYYQAKLFGPPPPVSLMFKARRKGNPLPFTLGLSQDDEEILNQLIGAVVLTDPIHTADEIYALGLKVSKMNTFFLHQSTQSN